MEYSAVAAIQRLTRRRGDAEAEVSGFAYRPYATTAGTTYSATTLRTSLLYYSPLMRVIGVNPDG